jgi:hypothetical protein
VATTVNGTSTVVTLPASSVATAVRRCAPASGSNSAPANLTPSRDTTTDANPEPGSSAVGVTRSSLPRSYRPPAATPPTDTSGAVRSTSASAGTTGEVLPAASVARNSMACVPSADTVTGPVYATHSPDPVR